MPVIETLHPSLYNMWDIYIYDENGVFKANCEPLSILQAEEFTALLDDDLVFFLLPSGSPFVGLVGLFADIE